MADKLEYHVQIQLPGQPDQWFTVARATTPEGAGEIVRVLLSHASSDSGLLRVEPRVAL